MASSLPAHWFHILLALAEKPQHGVGVTEQVRAQSEGAVELWPGMLYTALREMTADGYVAETEAPEGFRAGGGKPRFYRITPLGKKVSAAEAGRLARIVATAQDRHLIKVRGS